MSVSEQQDSLHEITKHDERQGVGRWPQLKQHYSSQGRAAYDGPIAPRQGLLSFSLSLSACLSIVMTWRAPGVSQNDTHHTVGRPTRRLAPCGRPNCHSLNVRTRTDRHYLPLHWLQIINIAENMRAPWLFLSYHTELGVGTFEQILTHFINGKSLLHL